MPLDRKEDEKKKFTIGKIQSRYLQDHFQGVINGNGSDTSK